MSAKVYESSSVRIWSPTTLQIASSTHWPSWSQAPSVCGCPKSPRTMGPSTALDDLGERDLGGRPCQDVATTHAALRSHEASALQGQEDLLQVGLGEARALGDVSHRRGPRLVGVERERQERSARIVTTSRHPHDLTVGPEVCFSIARCDERCPVTIPVADGPVLPDYAGACLTNIVPTLLGRPSRRPARMVPVGGARGPAGAPAGARRLGLAAARAQPPRSCRSWRACRAGRSPRSSRRPPRPRSRRSRPACRPVSTEWSATASTCMATC